MPEKKKLGLNDYDELIARLKVEQGMELEKAMKSNDPAARMKAQSYIKSIDNQIKQGSTKAFLFDPYNSQYTGQGYKREIKKVGFDVLKRMGGLHLSKMVKTTRIDQIKNFLNFREDDTEEGFTIRRKKGVYENDKKNGVSAADKKIVSFIVQFLENSKLTEPSGNKNSAIRFNPAKWDIYDDFDEFVTQIVNDSLTYDQLAFELQRNRKFELLSYKAIDASLIRFLDTIDKRFWEDATKQYDVVGGFLPRFAQVYGTEIQKNPFTGEPIVYYPWELGFGIRNKNTDIMKNGYGESELEVLVNIITWLLYGMEYNGNFFKNGSNPKGFINIKSGMGSQDNLNDFRETWRHMMTGAGNTHRIPVFEGIDMEWVDLQQSNKDMEFNTWIEFLMIMFCAVYTIDPSEMGWNFKQASQVFGQDGQKQRLEHSREKGLKPILSFLQKIITRYIVDEIEPGFEFVFTGIDLEDEEQNIKIIQSALTAGITPFEIEFEKYTGMKYDPAKHTILNPVFQQAQQMKMFGNPESNQAVDEQDENANPFDQFTEQEDENPIVGQMQKYIENNLGRKS